MCKNRRYGLLRLLHCFGNSSGCWGASTFRTWLQRTCSFKFLHHFIQYRICYWSFTISNNLHEAMYLQCRNGTLRILITQFISEAFFNYGQHFDECKHRLPLHATVAPFYSVCCFASSYIRNPKGPSVGRQLNYFFLFIDKQTRILFNPFGANCKVLSWFVFELLIFKVCPDIWISE